jgi:hypothetical protein
MESAEHVWIGGQITLEFDGEAKPAKDLKLHIVPRDDSDKTITYGQCIALGGDFYGVVGAPISTAENPQSAFRAAWASLVNAGKVMYPPFSTEQSEILRIVQKETDAVAKAIRDGAEPSTAYAGLGIYLSAEWALITALRYLALAVENWDHFGAYAVAAYKAGHAVACREAGLAAAQKDPAVRQLRLERAYAMNAFADHFLTDLFSAGHLRVPRKEMYDRTDGAKWVLGELCRTMHGEDGRYGLNVTNANGDMWTAYGDSYLLDTKSKRNAELAVQAVQDSASEVWDSYKNDTKVVKNKALLLVPDFKALSNRDDMTNFPGLFTLNERAQVERRRNMSSRDKREWTDQWLAIQTYFDLPKPADAGYTHVACYDVLTNKFLGWLSVVPATAGWNVGIVQDKTKSHGMKWCLNGGEFFLQKDTKGSDLYMGLGTDNVACWSTWGGWRRALRVNDDCTVSLSADPQRKLYLSGGMGGTFTVSWSDGKPNSWLIRIDFPLPQPTQG